MVEQVLVVGLLSGRVHLGRWAGGGVSATQKSRDHRRRTRPRARVDARVDARLFHDQIHLAHFGDVLNTQCGIN